MNKSLLTLTGLFCLCISITEVSAEAIPKPLSLRGNFNGLYVPYYGTDTNVFYKKCGGDLDEKAEAECLIIIPDADPKTFTIIVESGSLTPGIGSFAKDAKHVYRGGTVLLMADPKTFTLIDSSFAKDKRHVYYGAKLLRGVNARKFKKLNVFYGTDGRKVFYMDKVLRGADGRFFKTVKNHSDWAHDNSRVYYGDKIIIGLNPATLTVFSSFVAKDDHVVMCNGHELKYVDASTFIRLNSYYAKDKNHAYILVSGIAYGDEPCQSVTATGKAGSMGKAPKRG